MSCFNFIIVKVNGADVSNLPYEDAVQLFLNAKEPIIVEVRRRCFEENNKLSLFNCDTNKSPTLAVIAPSNSNTYHYSCGGGVDFWKAINSTNGQPIVKQKTEGSLSPSTMVAADGGDGFQIKEKPAISSISCQTDLSLLDCKSKEMLFMECGNDSSSGIFLRSNLGQVSSSTNVDSLDSCVKAEFDIEEITLTKSQLSENLGFTIAFGTERFSSFEPSGSNEYDEEESASCGKGGGGKEKLGNSKYMIKDKNARKCMIYVSEIVPNSLADKDGRLRPGDRILQINGQNILESYDPDKLLTENKDSVKILVSRFAYYKEDEFLDSAVYCDDKEYQEERHLSSTYEYEQHTFSPESSISQSDQHIATLAESTSTYPTLPIVTDSFSDLFCHANIKNQLDCVNREISLLNLKISVMKQLQNVKLKTEPVLQTEDEITRETNCLPSPSPKEAENKLNTMKPIGGLSLSHHIKKTTEKSKFDTENDHIYETIAEDETDVYYCSPYGALKEMRVEEWLKSISCSKEKIKIRGRGTEIKSNTSPTAALRKHIGRLDDCDNSSSAYNTGGSCNSTFFALDHWNNHTLESTNPRRRTTKKEGDCLQMTMKKRSAYRDKPNKNLQTSTAIKYRTQMPSAPFSTTISNIKLHSFDVESDSNSTLVAESIVKRSGHNKSVGKNKEEDMPEIVWKAKRRPDGTRYIVRRVIKEDLSSTTEKEANNTRRIDSTSAGDYAHKSKISRSKVITSTAPSKKKSHPHHWLV